MKKQKRTMHLRLLMCQAVTSWREAALVFEDQSGDGAPRKVTLAIEQPSDIAYIRERLTDIETSWQRALEALK